MKKKKILLSTVIALSMVLCFGIGVSAASSFTGKSEVSKGVIQYNDNIVIDGNSIGTWLGESKTTGTWTNGNKTTWSAGATLTIKDSELHPDSNVDIYYAESCKDIIAKSKVTYSQAQDETLVITFGKASPSNNSTPIVIQSMHITNPIAASTN